MHTLENDQLCVTISDHGAELSGIFDKKNDREILWNADPSHWKRHAPVLFPNVGRYYEDHCLINGKTYTSGQHGCPGYGIHLRGGNGEFGYTFTGIHG